MAPVTVPQDIIQKMRNLQMVSNRIRFLILVALYNSHVLKYGNSQTFTELQEVLNLSSSDLTYHLNLLNETKLITRNKDKNEHYNISEEGIRLMGVFGLSESRIKAIGKDMGIA